MKMNPYSTAGNRKPQRVLLSFAVILSACVLLNSCIGVESTISVSDDGTGTVALSYRVSHKVAHLGRLNEKEPLIPLPVNERDLERAVANTDGIELRSSDQEEDETDVYITAELDFGSIDALDEFFRTAEDERTFSLQQEGGETLFRYRIFSGIEETINPETMTMIETFFKDYTLDFTLNTPAPITGSNLGTIRDNGRTVSYSTSIPELFKNNNEVAWEIRW